MLKMGGKYRNEVWRDGLIDEAFRLEREWRKREKKGENTGTDLS